MKFVVSAVFINRKVFYKMETVQEFNYIINLLEKINIQYEVIRKE